MSVAKPPGGCQRQSLEGLGARRTDDEGMEVRLRVVCEVNLPSEGDPCGTDSRQSRIGGLKVRSQVVLKNRMTLQDGQFG